MLEGSTRYPSTVKKSGISIIGAGRIGRTPGRRLREQGWKIDSVVTPSRATARRAVRSIGGGRGSGDLSPSVLSAALPLTRQVFENLEHVGPRAAWTGPLARADYSVIAMREGALKPLPLEYLHAYRAVNRLAARLLARDSDSVLRELARVSLETDSQSQSIGAST